MSMFDELKECCRSWEPYAKLVGNIPAHAIISAIDDAEAELARLRAANARFRALVNAIDSCFLCGEFEGFDDEKWGGLHPKQDKARRESRKRFLAARRAVDEAGDLR